MNIQTLLPLLLVKLSMAAMKFPDFSVVLESGKNRSGHWSAKLMLEHPEDTKDDPDSASWHCRMEQKELIGQNGKKNVQFTVTVTGLSSVDSAPNSEQNTFFQSNNEKITGSDNFSSEKETPNYVKFAGIGCFKAYSERMTWIDANKVCSSDGAYLNIINSKIEEGMIDSLIADSTTEGNATSKEFFFIGAAYYLVGITNKATPGKFYTVFGTPLDELPFLNWASGQPDNPDEENCVSYRFQNGLYDVPCRWKLGFICEKESC